MCYDTATIMLKPQEIENLLTLARMELPATEKERLRHDIDSILGYVDQLREATTKKVPFLHDRDVRNVLRDDVSTASGGMYTNDLLHAAPQSEKGYIKVKKIL